MSSTANKWNYFETRLNAAARYFLSARSSLIAASSFALVGIAFCQGAPAAHSSKSALQQHYEAAFRFQASGNVLRAEEEYKVFLATALHRLANGDANLGNYAHAAPLYEEALRLAPNDLSLEMDYAGAALDASDFRKAKSLAASFLDESRRSGNPPDPRAISILAQALLELGDHLEALQQFKVAAKLRPGFDTASGLAAAYLMLGDKANAVETLSELKRTTGDTAALHMRLGILYGNAKFFDEAAQEFREAIAKDNALKGAHYSLGATYMMQSGDSGFDKAEAEFRKEVALDPQNALVYVQLGRIAFARHRYEEAEADLKHSIDLDSRIASAFIVLGQIYRETGKIPAAEAMLRKAITLNLDPSMNGYEIEQAHFWLGRLLIQTGNAAEGRKEMDISQNLLYQKEQLVESRLAGNSTIQTPLEKTHEANPQDLAAQRVFEKQIGPPIASSYDNLGVDAANALNYADAASFFEQAAKWDPTLNGIDENWARAAFAAKEYDKAVAPLNRVLALHPVDPHVRAMLGISLCMVHQHAQAVQVLRPIESIMEANPELNIAYSGSIAMATDYAQGLARLKSLEESNPETPLVHYLLGEVYAGKLDYSQAANELRESLKLDPTSAEAKEALALADLALGQKAEALELLSALAQSGAKDAEVYYRLARLQIELGSFKEAIGSLETAIQRNPMNVTYHRELAEVYRKNEQPDDADRETRELETLQSQGESRRLRGNVN